MRGTPFEQFDSVHTVSVTLNSHMNITPVPLIGGQSNVVSAPYSKIRFSVESDRTSLVIANNTMTK